MKLVGDENSNPQNGRLQKPEEASADGIAWINRAKPLRVRYPRIERLCRPQSESFWVLGGRPGAFKTALLWNLALNLAENRGRVLFVSLEMTLGEMALLALAKFSGIERSRIVAALEGNSSAPFTADETERWETAKSHFMGLQFVMRLHGHRGGRDIKDVLHSACLSRFDGVFIDHLGMIGRDSNGRELEQLSDAVHRLRGLSRGEAREGYRPWVVATTQLNREIDKGEEGRTPRMSDFRGSARIEHDADVAIGLQKRPKPADDESPNYKLDGFILKNRYGPPAVLLFEANGATGLVVERRPDEPPPPKHWATREPGEDDT